MGWNFPTGREDKRRVLLEAVAGWCVIIGATTIALQAAFLPDEAISQMFGGGQMPTAAGALMPTGEAIPAPGGYRVTGRWAFASGIRHATAWG